MRGRRGFRRKQAVQWFPPLGTEPEDGSEFPDWPAQEVFNLTLAGNTPDVAVVGLTWDFPTEEQVVLSSGLPSLADWQGSAWRLRRIVGKFFASAFKDPQSSGGQSLLTAGFIVLKVNEDDGSPLRAANLEGYDPQTVGQSRDPWIWRRSWMLNATGAVPAQSAIPIPGSYPQATAGYGSVADGPHIDQKTNRRIADEERLFFVASGRLWPPNVALEGRAVDIECTLDYRLLGSTMKQSNRRNASR